MEYLDGLNESQRQAAANIDGPMMIIAGAGSGKTRVLTFRIAHLIKQGIDPFNILALTFTNKAAREMTERISTMVGLSEAKNITMGTFHSVFSRILRYNADRIGYPQNFTIYDTADSKSLLKDIIKELNLDDKIYKPSLVLNRISTAKNLLISADDYLLNNEIKSEDVLSKKPELGRIYKTYQMRCFKAGAMDFDDLLFLMNVLFREHPDVLYRYQHKFKYILVDEYQDTNYAQYLIIKNLAAIFENICVVGDDAQSIYSFRGANIQNILNFKRDYPDFKLFKLEQNYRSTRNIVEAANSIIEKNQDRIKKKVWTDNGDGDKIAVIKTYTDNEEGNVIANRIYDTKMKDGLQFQDFAILYRTNRQSRAFEEALRKLNLPYKIYGGLSFYQRKEIRDLLAYFRLAANPNDEEAIKRVINYPKRGIGKTSIENLIIAANQNDTNIWDVINNFDKYTVAVSSSTKSKIFEFATMIQSFMAQMNELPAHVMAQQIAKSSGILKELHGEKDKGPEEVERYQNIEELLSGIRNFSNTQNGETPPTLPEFLMDVALLTDADQDKDEDKNKISMMTIHASKGLEFKHVYLVGVEENLFPSQLSLNTKSELEEERRLFYVALTRAEKSCTISYAASRYLWTGVVSTEPSRFISEISHEFLSFETPYAGGKAYSGQAGGRSLNPNIGINRMDGVQARPGSIDREIRIQEPRNLKSMKELQSKGGLKSVTTDFKVGFNVSHERFGKGKILKIEGTGTEKKATIFFPNVGSKTILLSFAKLEIID